MSSDAGHVALIGVDGGATEIRAHHVHCDDSRDPPAFSLGEYRAARLYQRVADFVPVPVSEQFAQRDVGKVTLTESERRQGTRWVAAACEVVAEVAAAAGGARVLVGIGMPGLKTANGRGIEVINNGPRIPDYLEQFERRLGEMGVRLARPVARLGSDADYCGLGELHAASGLFCDVDHAYYAGCGTGIADAMLLRRRLVTFDQACGWILKAWQIPSSLGPTFEEFVSAKAINEVYARLVGGIATGANPSAGGKRRYPEVEAAAGRPLAVAWMDTVAWVLAELVFERIATIANGRADAPHRGGAYAQLQAEHPYRGTLLDRIIIGQRVGQIYADPRYREVFVQRFERYLAALIAESGDAALVRHYLDGEALRAGVCRASKLRAAPALGAAVAAWQGI